MLPFVAPALLAWTLETPPKPTSQDLDFAAAQARVALSFYRALEAEGGNLICSPFSVARALAMAREGAAGTTAEELDRALAFPPDLRARFAALARLLEPPQHGRGDDRHGMYTLELATSLWGQEGLAFAPDFCAALKEGYDSELLRANFAKPDLARAEINEWTAKHTAGRIPEIIPEGVLDADTRLVLIDTIRFLAKWETPFKAENTRPAPFTPGSGKPLDVPTMHRTARLAYAETELAQVLELPYELGATSMLIVLPKAAGGLAAVTAQEDVALWTAKLEPRDVELALPKFRFEWAQEIKPALRTLGVHAAFEAKSADFSRILTRPEPLFVSHVLHRALVAVDEQGTEAVAATAVVMTKGSRPPSRRRRWLSTPTIPSSS
jgi:serpin B